MQKHKIKKDVEQDGAIILTPENPRYSLLWLHGLGDSSKGFLDFFVSLSPELLTSGARICLLQAPKRAVTANGGYHSNSWYDIKTFDRANMASKSDQELFGMDEMRQSAATVQKKVDNELAYWKSIKPESPIPPLSRIFVGGFSQGCAVSLFYGLQCKDPVAGIIGYSGHLLRSVKLDNLDKTDFLLFHGESDPLLVEKITKQSYKRILDNKRVSYTSLKGVEHTVTEEELASTVKWLQERTKLLD